jgi:fucose 4-O-acetylase-like acetyltransferase
MERKVLPAFVSTKLKFWSFVSMILLVFVHGYNLEMRYLRPWSAVYEEVSLTGFMEYFLANGIFRFRIPMLFAISGYLYAMNDSKPNGQRFRKRLRTILVPYLLWSTFSLGLTYILEIFPSTRNLIVASRLFTKGHGYILLHDHGAYPLLRRWLIFPVAFQLWFLRVLIVYSLAYPVLRWCIMHKWARWIYFSIAIALWFYSVDMIWVEGEGLLFFSLGIWLQKTDFNIERPGRLLNPLIWGTVFVVLAAVKTWIAFKGMPVLGRDVYEVLVVLHKTVLFSGLIACWFGLDFLVRWFMDKRWFVSLSAFSFVIYAMHAPIVSFGIDPSLNWLHSLAAARSIAFVLLPLVIISLCVVSGAILRKVSPRGYGILTGGRGF